MDLPDTESPIVVAALRILAVVVASLLVVVGLFGEEVVYALWVGVILGVGFAVVAALRDRLLP